MKTPTLQLSGTRELGSSLQAFLSVYVHVHSFNMVLRRFLFSCAVHSDEQVLKWTRLQIVEPGSMTTAPSRPGPFPRRSTCFDLLISPLLVSVAYQVKDTLTSEVWQAAKVIVFLLVVLMVAERSVGFAYCRVMLALSQCADLRPDLSSCDELPFGSFDGHVQL